MPTTKQPVRVRRSRAKGSHLTSPNGLPVVVVSRGTRWGNPFRLEDYRGPAGVNDEQAARAWSVESYRSALKRNELGFTVADAREALRGKNLACWCPLEGPCHADVLLEIANAKPTARKRAAGAELRKQRRRPRA